MKFFKDIFIENAIQVHGYKYNYSLVVSDAPVHIVDIICETHGVFSIVPSKHISGHGCPICDNAFVIKNRNINQEELDSILFDYERCSKLDTIINNINDKIDES